MTRLSGIKPSQLTRVGYTYQDLMCIRMLINWYHEPEKYQWMSIEDNQGLGGVKSLDDVICFTASGEYELYQVKFTIDSTRDDLRLDFDWLLKKKPKGTSLIEKWSADLERFGDSNVISIAKLITNRKPDTVLSNCLHENKIDYNLVPDEVKSRVSTQLGDERKAITFFENLIFEHSQHEIDDLEFKLQDSLVPDHANNESWLQLLKTVERWATRKNEPSPDGRICLEHIHEILSLGSKRTISQFFEVPGGYIPPLEEFHSEILERTTKPGCSVISGLPGMGKSTYLSFLTDQLIEKKTPVIRHHYYLSPHFIGDRIAFNNAAQSLQSQIKSLYPSDFSQDELDPEKLDMWIRKAADMATESNEILVVIIDGLDHVYRERSDISQLEHLVNRIDPLKEKICLLYGTQPISDEYLPNSLLRSAPRDKSWLDIPAMGLAAIKDRVDFLVSIEEINVVGVDEHRRQEVVEISQALLDISKGYPLHIIYSLNSMKLARNKINKYDVERLPICPDGDIHAYYENLWVSLSESAKEILLLIVNADFSWPDKTHLEFCFDDSLIFRNSFTEIQHLIENRLSGITPFHNSLFVYLKRKDAFSKSKERLNKKSKTWIDRHAPEYWKWGWDWIIQANLGNATPLLQGITKEWLVQSLCKAYPLEHIEHIVGVAESIAFEQSLYSELLRLRTLKMRLLNGPEFQIQDFSQFLDCSLNCSSDTFGLLWRADNLRIIPDNEIVIVAKHLQGKNKRIVKDCEREIYRRIQFYARLEDSNHYQTLNSLVDDYLQVLMSYENPDLEVINEFYERLTDKSSSFTRIVELLIQYGHRHLLLDLSVFDIPKSISSKIIDEVVLAACIEGVSLTEAFPNLRISNSSLGLLHLLLNGKDIESDELPQLECPEEYEGATYNLFYQYFFNTLAHRFSNSVVIEEPHLVEPNSIEEFIKNAWVTFQYASTTIAEKLKAGDKFEVSDLYNCFVILALPDQYRMGYKLTSILFNIRKSLAKISLHLSIICDSVDERTMFNESDFSMITESLWWNSHVFFDVSAQNSIISIPKGITSQAFHKLFDAETHRREDTATLANDSLAIGILASKYGLHDEASLFLKRAALNMVGYGHRKDITLHEVFEAIDECSNSNCPQVPGWLRRVATFTTDVFDFSEREIGHIPNWFTKLLAKHNPERLVDEFDYHLSEENWHRTDVILENIIKTFPLSTQSEHSFLRCMTTVDSLRALKERAEGNATLDTIYQEQYKILGGIPPLLRELNSTEHEETSEFSDVKTIQPNNLDEFRSTLHSISYKVRKKFVIDWITYWKEQGQGAIILNSFNEYYEQEKSDYELDRCLHEIFLLSKDINGKTKAYTWAVRDIKLNNSWNRYSHSQSEESLREYGSTYKNKWENILRDTMSAGSSKVQRDEAIIVPSTQLVIYLVAAGQLDLAAEITEAMVSGLEGDIAHLPLNELYWYKQPIEKRLAPLHLIYLHYKWPDRYARLQTAKQISMLLQDDANTEFRSLYIQYLSKQQYEVDIVDYLSILLLIEKSPFHKEEIVQNIRFPSIISDELISKLGYMDAGRDDLTPLYSEFLEDLIPNRAKYERYANGLALRYIMTIEELEKEHKAPLVKHFLLEWEQIQERHFCPVFNPHNFCGDQFSSRDKISCSFSWTAESSILSAYTRTLAYAIDQYSIPVDMALMHAEEVLPFGSIAINLSPSDSPKLWPRLDDLKKDDLLPGQSELEQYLSQIANSDEILLHANGPVLRNYTGVCIDLRVILVSIHDIEMVDPHYIFDSINSARNTKEGIFPLAKWTWPPSFGRWEIDWLSRGYFRPTYCVGDLPISSVTQNESSVEYFGGTVSNGVWRYWVEHWYPAHRIEVGSSLGTYMTVSKDFFSKFKEHTNSNYYLVAEMTCVDRREFMRDEDSIVTFAIQPI
ncbi:NACHT domain protein [Vibrio crassostreae]|nr:NACHT domain protein [Vibrio crassostreae]CAK3509417.1 NACHT domain protein [Vibrio crassostreae]CAK3515803.1 NACHT domain protein [Vibrio crassostreae]CAK3546185.1 NACHT domain protein [Vibrio crassostreae]CAK3610139.1 NACHT domain protein [Vibrio crassostreae]